MQLAALMLKRGVRGDSPSTESVVLRWHEGRDKVGHRASKQSVLVNDIPSGANTARTKCQARQYANHSGPGFTTGSLDAAPPTLQQSPPASPTEAPSAASPTHSHASPALIEKAVSAESPPLIQPVTATSTPPTPLGPGVLPSTDSPAIPATPVAVSAENSGRTPAPATAVPSATASPTPDIVPTPAPASSPLPPRFARSSAALSSSVRALDTAMMREKNAEDDGDSSGDEGPLENYYPQSRPMANPPKPDRVAPGEDGVRQLGLGPRGGLVRGRGTRGVGGLPRGRGGSRGGGTSAPRRPLAFLQTYGENGEAIPLPLDGPEAAEFLRLTNGRRGRVNSTRIDDDGEAPPARPTHRKVSGDPEPIVLPRLPGAPMPPVPDMGRGVRARRPPQNANDADAKLLARLEEQKLRKGGEKRKAEEEEEDASSSKKHKA
ncbi:hypothetical protein FB45DRAFT_1037921 [Roridomyces roridus]|uniref:Uncharacterized protein n=1 Tax=Roridomyces roridus TaxID=1738132 RepID=A0AAD7B4C1_9AGAR|nr:hypothetical protein FB45DRAFT_1037921 [Roridomyces roridus]